MSRRLWIISGLLIMAVLPAIALVPQASSDYGGGGGGGNTTDMTTTTVLTQLTGQVTAVPENIHPLLVLMLVLGVLTLLKYRKH